MSWFDTSGLASLAKTALKEAQKKIDKALDIQDETAGDIIAHQELLKTIASKKLPGSANREKSKTDPNTPVTTPAFPPISSASSVTASISNAKDSAYDGSSAAGNFTSTWGSFTGSFFDNPNAKEMVTTPPKSVSNISIENMQILPNVEPGVEPKRQSITSNSDSVELLSPPTSPCSALTSPSEAIRSVSESVEQITTPTTSEVPSPETNTSLRDSIVIIANDDAGEEDLEDSLSYSTVMEDTMTSTTTMTSMAKQHSTTSEDSKSLISDVTINPSPVATQQSATNILNSSSSSTGASNLLISMDDALFESQTFNSDSTQSFEDVQMHTEMGSNVISLVPRIFGKSNSISSDDKSDMVKIVSGPSSSDEIETTTSSDIEIISNPNADSSSTNSVGRFSPSKLKKQSTTAPSTALAAGKKGHFREPSEVSILSEDSQSETDKFLLRISELNEILEARELRLVEFGRQNAELQERNHELQQTVDAMRSNTAHLDSAEEYTQRLSALEKKFQASIRERDALRIQLKSLKDELQTKIPRDDLTQVVTANNAMINELRTEGEKLSKEILLQSNIIKKLRAKEKTSDSLLKKNKDQIADLIEEVEHLKKTLHAKEEVERSQIEAVHKMSSEKRKLDEENLKQRSLIEDLQSKLSTLQNSFDAVKVELQQRTRLQSDLTRTTEEASAAQKEKAEAQAKCQELILQLNELRDKLRYSEQMMTTREQKLREENALLLRRLEDSEVRAENLTHQLGETTIPLMRQLEALQATLTQRTTNWNKQEKQLLLKLESSEMHSRALENVETTFKEKVNLLQTRCFDLEEKLSHALMQEEKSRIVFHQTELDFKRQISKLNETVLETKTKLDEVLNLNKILENKIEAQQLHISNTNSTIQAHEHRELTAAALNEVTSQEQEHNDSQRPQSPNLSLGRNSLDEAMGGSVDWQLDDLDCISNSGRQVAGSIYGMHINVPYMGHNATTMEHLQSLLKQRDGEVSQLQWELSRMQAERVVLNEEISSLTLEMELIKDKLITHETLEENFAELQHQYDALLQMYGEKVERTEELELDLLEVKEAYKEQIDELLGHSKNRA